MCGIFATTADQDSAQTILEGLKRLEYRGYDSWGIAVKAKNKLKIDKHAGKISQSQTGLPKSAMGIGHTRWATHGGVTDKNSHPHLDCTGKIAVAHNGIIDNWQALKESLKHHHFKSQTDSEIVTHLLEDELQSTPDLFMATAKVFKRLQGLNAILVLHQDYDYLVAAKTGSPLVIGFNPGNHLISSDVASLLPFTSQVIFLDDGQIAKVSSDQITIQDLGTNKQVSPRITKINWKSDSANKGNYEHFMLKEIYEQPQILEQMANKLPAAQKLAQSIKKAKGTFTVACGSAAYAALVGQYFFSKIAKTHINPALGSEFYYHADFLNKNSLCIALSQSGETIDTIQSVKYAKARSSHTAALVNVMGSTLDRLTDYTLYLDAGPEKAVASTKAFLAKVALLLLTSHSLANTEKEGLQSIKKAAIETKRILHENTQMKIARLASLLKENPSIFIIGRGQSYPVALEIALKIKEISYIHAEGFPAGELKHGVIALIQKNTPVLVLAPADETYHDVLSAAMEIKARGGTIIGFSESNNPVFDHFFEIKDAGSATVIPHIVLGQTLAYHLAKAKGLDPDMPRNLAKSVTVK